MAKRSIGGMQALLMALTLGKKNPRGSVGLDLDGAFVAAVQAQDGRISRAASMELPSGVITDGEVSDVERLTESLKTFFKENDLPTRVRLGVSNQQIVVRHLELPLIEEEAELAAAVRFQAAEAIAMPLDEVVLDHQVVGEGVSPEGSARLRRDACAGLGFLGLTLDDAPNEGDGPADRLLSPSGASVAVTVVAAREDVEIAGQVLEVLGRASR